MKMAYAVYMFILNCKNPVVILHDWLCAAIYMCSSEMVVDKNIHIMGVISTLYYDKMII